MHRNDLLRAERPVQNVRSFLMVAALTLGTWCGGAFDARAQADLHLGLVPSALRVAAGDEVTVTVGVTNAGPARATGVALSASVSTRSTLVSSSPGPGTCNLVGGVLNCQFGDLPSNGVASVSVTIHTGAGANPIRVGVGANELDPIPGNNTNEVLVTGIALQEWVNPDAALGPELEEGPFDIYPLQIEVSGQTSRVDKVMVTLHNLSHEWPDDLDILLVGPHGERVFLMSDCGLDNAFTDLTLTFDDDSTNTLPNNDPPIVSGIYRPTNFDRLSDNLAAPAPPEPYLTNLSVFKGTIANGTWSLYLMDDSPENQGYITDGWSLTFELADPVADLRLSVTGPPSPIPAGRSALYEVAVTNAGPAQAATTLRYELPPGFRFVGSVASQGGCAQADGVIHCDFGDLASGARATAIFDLVPANGGTFTNRARVSTPLLDTNPTNDVANFVTTVTAISDLILVSPTPDTDVRVGQTVVTQYGISNAGPSVTTVVMSMIVTPGLSIVSSSTSVGACVNLEGTVACDFGLMPVGAVATVNVTTRGVALGEARAVSRLDGVAVDPRPNDNTVLNNIRVVPGPLQAPTITGIARSPAGVAIQFDSALGRQYTLEFKGVLGAGAWQALGTAAGSGGILTLSDTNSAGLARFYRIRAE